MSISSLGNKALQTSRQQKVVCLQELEIFICCCINVLAVFKYYRYFKRNKLGEIKQIAKFLKRLLRLIRIFTLANNNRNDEAHNS